MEETSDQITRTLPVSPEHPIDAPVFREFLAHAQDELLEMWAAYEPAQRQWSVWRPNDDGLSSYSLPIPNYFAEKGVDLPTLRQLPGIARFLEYLWDNGRHRITLTGKNPSRGSWEQFVLVEELATPLRTALTHAALDEVITCGKASNWTLPEAKREELLDDLADIHCRGIMRFTVKCPLCWATGEKWNLGNGVRLSPYSRTDVAKYLTEIEGRIATYDLVGLMMSDVAMLEFRVDIDAALWRRGRPPRPGWEVLEERISDQIDLIKWAIHVAGGSGVPLIEGITTYRNVVSGGLSGLAVLRRFAAVKNRTGIRYQLSSERMENARRCFLGASRYAALSDDLYQALWYWGRACLAQLDRDRLLEATIGLERLLVRSGPENRYKFGLHGASFLSVTPDEANTTAKMLREIYDGRSSAAHGGARTSKQLGFAAIGVLGNLIQILIEKFECGLIDPGQSIAEQIEQIVLKRATMSFPLAQK